jgi:hypothetical protein
MFILWNGKILRKRGVSPFKSLSSSPSPTLLFQSSCSSSPLPWILSVLCPPLLCKEDPAAESGITRQGYVVCFGRIDRPIEGLRCCKGNHWRSWRAISQDGRSAMVCGQLVPRDEGRSPLVLQGSPCTRGRGTCLVHALSPRPTIGKEHRSVMPTCLTTGILTPRKVTIRCQVVVPSSSSNDDLPLVKHDARVDLNPAGYKGMSCLDVDGVI